MRAAAVLAALYALLAVLVATGALDAIDQGAVDGTMRAFDPSAGVDPVLERLLPFRDIGEKDTLGVAAELVTLPGAPVVSVLLVGALLLVVRRRRGPAAAVAGGIAYVAANLVELLCKEVVVRPPLTLGAVHVEPFDQSWPSGHALRTAVAAFLVAWLLPRLRPLAAAWLLAAAVLLVVDAWHVPSDVAGGIVLAALAAAVPRLARARETAPAAVATGNASQGY
jgi:membrane-associated phospholipid phosphatase